MTDNAKLRGGYDKCCAGKKGYSSVKSAMNHYVKKIKSRRGLRYPLEPYLCPFCQRYHLGRAGFVRKRG